MLGTLCTLITALTCVSGVTVVTQKPPVVALRKGETATMDCNLGTVTNSAARWYKQIPGGVPQFVLRFYHGWSSPRYGSGFSSPKFTSTHQSQSDYRLIINNVEEGDSAVYYCKTWDNSVNDVFISFSLSSPHTPTLLTSQLDSVSGVTVVTQKPPVVTMRKGETATMDCNLGTVTGSSLPPPVLTVFPPSSAELQSNKATLVCLSSQSVPFADVSWLTGGSPVSSGISTSTAVQQPDQTFQISSYLDIQTSDWNMDKVYTCSSLPPPVLTVFPPSSAELQSNKATLVCLSSQSVPFADVSWLTGGSPVSSGISTSTAVQQPDQTFQISSYLDIQTSDWNMDKVYTCKVSLGSQTSEKNINKSGCPTEE
ncbi:Immunoglobulin lambda constant 6 [Larimichthys crocea]|nr:Immunoglobulin lambda constant 6 [Larimichthys crocea]